MHCVIYLYVRAFTHNTCKQMAHEDGGDGVWCGNLELPISVRESVFWHRAGRPRKYKGSWFSANKRIYLAELTLEKLRAIKSSYRLGSDDAAVQHLIARHECLCATERQVINRIVHFDGTETLSLFSSSNSNAENSMQPLLSSTGHQFPVLYK